MISTSSPTESKTPKSPSVNRRPSSNSPTLQPSPFPSAPSPSSSAQIPKLSSLPLVDPPPSSSPQIPKLFSLPLVDPRRAIELLESPTLSSFLPLVVSRRALKLLNSSLFPLVVLIEPSSSRTLTLSFHSSSLVGLSNLELSLLSFDSSSSAPRPIP